MIIGTAGHIDHGKTSLVKALTGVDTDRLPEEKRRGITLELGFAHLTLDDGTHAGVVDVPGHERFVKAMVAGAGGVDLAVLVVAADEGVMPQTREHLDICRLLGVRAGVVALTKADLLPELGPEWRGLLDADVKALVEGTFLEGAPVVPVSARDGQGLAALRTALTRAAATLPRRPVDGPAFLPVDRAFSLKGFGTVVTGTLLSGQLSTADHVSLLPGLPGPLRVRGLQVHGKAVERAAAGSRVAVNVPDVEAEAISRGQVLTRHGELPETRMLDVELEVLPALEGGLKTRRRLLVHLGTAQAECSVALLDVPALEAGESGLAQLRLAVPLAALPGQRFILRGSHSLPGRGATLAGGRVLALATRRRRKGAGSELEALRDADHTTQVAWLLGQAGWRGLTEGELHGRSGLGPKPLARALELLGAARAVVLVDRERRLFVAAETLRQLEARTLALLEDFHTREPMREGLPREELRQRLSPELDARLLARTLQGLEGRGEAEARGDVVRLPGRGRAVTAVLEGAHAQLVTRLEAAGLAPPTVNELAREVGLTPPRVVELLKVSTSQGAVVRVSDELYFDAGALGGLKARLVAHLKEKGDITTQAFKELVGGTRKFVIPLSEYFDRERVTLRVGEKRQLRRG